MNGAQAIATIEHNLGSTVSAKVGALNVINDAGEMLFGAYPWNFNLRVGTLLDLVQDQSYISLPADFDQLVDVRATDGLVRYVLRSTVSEVEQLRSLGSFGDPLVRYLAKSTRTVNTIPTPVLEIYPTPEAAETGAIRLSYRVGWTKVTSDNQEIPIPPWFSLLFKATCIGLARGYHGLDTDAGSLDAQMAKILDGQILAACKAQDSRAEPYVAPRQFGWMRNSIDPGFPKLTGAVPDP